MLARAAPIGASAPMMGWEPANLHDAHPAPEGIHGRGRDLYCAGEPAFLAGAAKDVVRAFEQLQEELGIQDWNRRPLITLCSRGYRYTRQRDARLPHLMPHLAQDRVWNVTFAADPAQRNFRAGPQGQAHPGCTGQCGLIQAGIAAYGQFKELVADVRGRLAQDLFGPLLCRPDATPVPVTYAYVCRSGRHRSVAVVELLAHCLHTCGVANVQVVHEDLPNGHYEDRHGRCGCPENCHWVQRCSDSEQKARIIQLYNNGLETARHSARLAWATWGER